MAVGEKLTVCQRTLVNRWQRLFVLSQVTQPHRCVSKRSSIYRLLSNVGRPHDIIVRSELYA